MTPDPLFPHAPDSPRPAGAGADSEALFSFVWARTEDIVRDAARRHDLPRHRFSAGTLRVLTGVRDHLDGESIGSYVAHRYLRRVAAQHANHHDFREEWRTT